MLVLTSVQCQTSASEGEQKCNIDESLKVGGALRLCLLPWRINPIRRTQDLQVAEQLCIRKRSSDLLSSAPFQLATLENGTNAPKSCIEEAKALLANI